MIPLIMLWAVFYYYIQKIIKLSRRGYLYVSQVGVGSVKRLYFNNH